MAIVLGGIAGLVPLVSALVALTDPIRRKGAASPAVRVTTVDSLPPDGIPRKFPVFSAKTDAWNKFASTAVGAVYLRRTSEKNIEALNVVCPHAGCFVDYVPKRGDFICPCHKSSFKLDGSIASAKSPSQRGLDTLPVEIRDDGTIWVEFQNFRGSSPKKIPIS